MAAISDYFGFSNSLSRNLLRNCPSSGAASPRSDSPMSGRVTLSRRVSEATAHFPGLPGPVMTERQDYIRETLEITDVALLGDDSSAYQSFQIPSENENNWFMDFAFELDMNSIIDQPDEFPPAANSTSLPYQQSEVDANAEDAMMGEM